MEANLSGHQGEFFEKIAGFGQNHILISPELGNDKNFPSLLWDLLGRQGLLNPETLFHGPISPCQAIVKAGRTFVFSGGNFGMALSWMIHHLTAQYLLAPYLLSAQRRALWERICKGKATLAFAVSEPSAGAHPKYMMAKAAKQNLDYLVSGEKIYLTNGPIADYFVIIAITGQREGKKAFSAFLAPKETPGLVVCPAMTLDFFNPSPHGKILMNNCGLEQETLLGKEGRAFSDMVLLFRKIEDAAMTGPVTGAMGFVLSRVIQKMKGVSKIAPQFLDGLGRLETMVAAAVCLSDQIALAADKNEAKLESLVLYFRQMTGEYLKVLDQILNGSGIDLDLPCKYLILDLAAASRMGKSMAGIRREKLGVRLLDPGRTCWNPSFITDPV